MAVQTDGYNADTEEMSAGNSPDRGDSEAEQEREKSPERAAVVLQRLDLNGGPPFSAREYLTDSEFTPSESDSPSGRGDSDADYGVAKLKKKRRRRVLFVPCGECRRMFPSQKALAKHQALHLGTHTCQVCEKRCVTAASLKLHSRMHGSYKPHVCDECGEAFPFRLQLDSHQLKHDGGVRPHACNQCDAAYKRAHHLASHMKTHLDKSHECDFCGRAYTGVLRLRHHVQLIHKAQKKQDQESDARRSGRTVRIDYNDDVINVEAAAEVRRQRKHAKKAVDRVQKVASRLRQREDDQVANKKTGKGKKRGKITKRVHYTGRGTKPSRASGRKAGAVDYGESMEEESSVEEEEEEEGNDTEGDDQAEEAATPRSTAAAQSKRQNAIEQKTDASSKVPLGRGRARKAAPAESDDDDDEEEEEREESPVVDRRAGTGSTPTVRQTPGRARGRARSEQLQENGAEDEEQAPTPTRRGRAAPPTPVTSRATDAEDVSDEEEQPSATRRATPRLAAVRGTPTSRTPSKRSSRSSAAKLRYAEDIDSGVGEAEPDTARKGSKREVRGSAGGDNEVEEEGEDDPEPATPTGRAGRRGKKDESTMPPKKRLRGRQ